LLSKKLNRRILNIAALISLISIITLGVVIANIKTELRPLQRKNIDTSIVRLHDVRAGRFFCSGAVISPTRILTAAHCVIEAGLFGTVSLTDSVEIRAQDGKPINLKATVEAANPRQDLAILKGDFRGMDIRPIVTNASEINRIFMNPASKITMCGFPDAGPLRCSRIEKVDRTIFFFAGAGFLYPGMSGGPVIDMNTGAIIAVNQAVTQDGRAVVSPLIELYDQLGIHESSN
jgi:hypothetical protein